MTERQFQMQVMSLFRRLHWWAWHVTNEGKRSRKQGYQLKQLGLLPGVCDIWCGEPWEIPDGFWIGKSGVVQKKFVQYNLTTGWIRHPKNIVKGKDICIELKIWPNKLSNTQEEFLHNANARHCLTAVCYDFDEVLIVLRCIKPINGVMPINRSINVGSK